jgi:hypothetical protein
MSATLDVGDKVEADDGTIGTVTCVYDDGGFDITYDDGMIEYTDVEGNTEIVGEVEEDPMEKRKRENIALGRHPLFVPLMDAPANAASTTQFQRGSRGPM